MLRTGARIYVSNIPIPISISIPIPTAAPSLVYEKIIPIWKFSLDLNI